MLNELKMLIHKKYIYSGYDTGFDSRSEFSLSDGNVGINVIIFGVNMSSSVHIDNKINILILGEVPAQGLDDTTLTAEAQYSRLNNIFCLYLHYNGGNSFLFNATEIYQFKAKDSEIEKTPCVLEIIQEVAQPTT